MDSKRGVEHQQPTLVWVEDADCTLGGFLAYSSDWDGTPVEKAKFILEDLADFLDQEAEGRNNHAFVGTHRVLAVFLSRKLGREETTGLFWQLCELGGLDALSGLYNGDGFESAFKLWGIGDCWKPWKIKD